MMSLGMGLASLSTKVYQLLLTQGLLYGIGASCLYFPILAAAPEYFNSHRGTAMGIVLSGAGMGGLIMAPAIRALITAVGGRWTLRCLAFVNLLISLPIAVTASPSRYVGRRRTHLDLKLALKPSFLFSVAAAFLQAGGNGLPMTFIADYSVAIGYSASFGATLLAMNNGINSVSRIAMGWMGDKVGRQNTLIANVMLCALLVGSMWMSSVGKGGDGIIWIVFIVFYGFASGGYNALFPTVGAFVLVSPSCFILFQCTMSKHRYCFPFLGISPTDCPPDNSRGIWHKLLRQRSWLLILRPRLRCHVRKSRRRKDPRGE
jgi:MFS family permease